MSDSELSTKEQIIKTTLDIIGKRGTQKVTTREIADSAKVNVAAINYYFGSKENLVNNALQYLLQSMQKAFELSDYECEVSDRRLMGFLKEFSRFITMYPGVMKSVISMMMEGEISPDLEEGLIKIAKLFGQIIGQLSDIKDKKMLNFATAHIMSSLILPLLLSNYGITIFGIDYFDAEMREQYIETLLKNI